MNNQKKYLTCTQCGFVSETFSEMEYSQGNLVCKKCKNKNRESDNRAFDRDMRIGSIYKSSEDWRII